VVSGRVQGVWFRAATREKAVALRLSGHAVNLPDGRVEVLVCGAADAVEKLRNWLWQGPELARVASVDCQSEAVREVQGFTTG
jgi:acylphosphatase